jgi:hypothetical protein
MNDDFLTHLREEPRPEFARELWQKLQADESAGAESPRLARTFRPRTALASLAAAAAFVLFLTIPSVRAAAQGFLDLFRVKRIAAVPTDFKRLDRLAENVDMKAFIGDQVQVLVDPGRLEGVEDVDTAAALTGLEVQRPSVVPVGYTGPTVRYRRAGQYKVTADMSKVESVLQALDIDDMEVPWEANGAVFTVKAPPLVELVWTRGESEIVFEQVQSPEVDLPPGVDLRRLGEILLRVQGLTAGEARSFAKTIDWTSTLVIPVPTMGSEYHEVDIKGAKGLLVTMHQGTRRRANGSTVAVTSGPRRSALIWTVDGHIYSLSGRGQGADLLQMAHSIR